MITKAEFREFKHSIINALATAKTAYGVVESSATKLIERLDEEIEKAPEKKE